MQIHYLVRAFSERFTEEHTAEVLAKYIYTNTVAKKLKAIIFTDVVRRGDSVRLIVTGYGETGSAIPLPEIEVANADFSWLFKTAFISLTHTDGVSQMGQLRNLQNLGVNATALEYEPCMSLLSPNAVLVTSNNFLYLFPKFRSLLKWSNFQEVHAQKYRTLVETKEKFKRIDCRAYSKLNSGDDSTIFKAVMEDAGFKVNVTRPNSIQLALKQWRHGDKLYELRITPLDCYLVVSDKNTIQVQKQYSLDRDSLSHAEQMLRRLRVNASEVLKIADLRVNLSALTTLY